MVVDHTISTGCMQLASVVPRVMVLTDSIIHKLCVHLITSSLSLSPLLPRCCNCVCSGVLLQHQPRRYSRTLCVRGRDPPLTSEEIIWRGPDGQEVMNVEGKTSLQDKNTRLVIRNVELADSGTYTISVEREISLGEI